MTARKGLAVLMLAITAVTTAKASKPDGHLLPSGPDFDIRPPYGKKTAEILESLLFPESSWTVRYFESVHSKPSYETGITLYRKANGHECLMIKQATPDITSIVMNSYYGRVDLKTSLAAVKIKTSNKEVPAEFAIEMRVLWLALLNKTRPNKNPDDRIYIHPPAVILSAKEDKGLVLTGKYPSDAADQKNFVNLQTILDDIFKTSAAPDKNRTESLLKIRKRMRLLRDALLHETE